jgi:hypothetical protein
MPPGVRTTHHVKIGDHYYLVKPGTYRRRPAPMFGARFTTGDPDYSLLTAWQYWAQTCWVGGFGAETWADDAMYDEGIGIDSSQHEVMVLSRDLGPNTGPVTRNSSGNWDLNAGDSGVAHRKFVIFNDTLYLLQAGSSTTSRLYKFDTGTATWSLIRTFSQVVRDACEFAGYLVFGDDGTTLTRMDTSETFTTFAKPASVTATAYVVQEYGGKLYCGFNNKIWRLKEDFTWDGSTAFYAAVGVNYITQAEIHLGFLYLASENGHVLRTDGNNTFDLWQFEPHVKLRGMRSFDGRLFIMAGENLAGTTSMQSVLYQFSGSAVTELKRWGKVGLDVTPTRLRAFQGKLFFGASSLLGMSDTADGGFGIAMYDPIEDAYHLFATMRDGATYSAGTEGINHVVDDVMYWKGYLYCVVRGHGVFRTLWSYKDVTRYQATYDTSVTGAIEPHHNGGWYKSSDFDAGTPGLLKLWNAITVHVDLPTTACMATIWYSLDGGENWTNLGDVTKDDPVETRYAKTYKIQDGSETLARSTRFKYRILLKTSDTTRTPQLRGVIVRYLPIPEPNWVWDMTLVLSEEQELLDETIESPDNETKLAALETAFREQNLVAFTDATGTAYASGGGAGVLIQSMEERIPHIDASSHGELEREIAISIMEMVDEYPGGA